MTNIPNKLPTQKGDPLQIERLTNAINDILDYLQTKEEASNLQDKVAEHVKSLQHEYDEVGDKCSCGREKKSVYHIEASKGEILCNKCGHRWSNGNQFLCPNCFGKEIDPPESKGECDGYNNYCPSCGVKIEEACLHDISCAYKKNNPPEREDYLDKLIEDLVNISDWRGNLSINYVFDYIQARYVSKEKIKRYACKECINMLL